MESSLGSTSEVHVVDGSSRIRDLLESHLSGARLRSHFADLALQESEEEEGKRIGAQVVDLITAPNLTQEGRTQCWNSILAVVSERVARNSTSSYDQAEQVQAEILVKYVVIQLCEAGVIGLKLMCETIVNVSDFGRLVGATALFRVVRDNLRNLDYKGVRDIMKQLLEKLGKVAPVLPPHHADELKIVEEIVSTIADRENNLLPAYLVMNELHRLSTTLTPPHRSFTLGTVAESFAKVFSSFRPLAELVSVVGRPYLVPVMGHPGLTGNCMWRLEPMSLRLSLKGQLPYHQDYLSRQNYQLHQILRQPHGREMMALHFQPKEFRTNAQMGLEKRLALCNLSEIICLILIEAMEDAEADESPKEYRWLSLANLFVFSIVGQLGSFSQILQSLYTKLQVLPYRKARDELMWLLLQYVSGAKVQNSEGPLVLDLYRLLYTGEDEFVLNGRDSSCVKKMAPTCLWIHLSQKISLCQAVHLPPSVQNQMKFLEDTFEQRRDSLGLQDYILAVVCNAYSILPEKEELVMQMVRQYLDSSEIAPLPLGPKAGAKSRPLPLSLLDAFSLHMKMLLSTLIKQSYIARQLDQDNMASHFPSPAIVDTYVRLMATAELDGLKTLVMQTLPRATGSNRLGLIHLIAEILSYRLPPAAIPQQIKIHLVLHIRQSLMKPEVSAHPQMAWLLESTLIRHLLWLQSGDCLQFMLSKFPVLFAHDSGGSFSEELSRVKVMILAKALHVSGSSESSLAGLAEAVGRLEVRSWPSTTLALFPEPLAELYSNQPIPPHIQERPLMEQQTQDEYIKWRTLGNEASLIEHFTRPEARPVFLILLHRVIMEGGMIPGFTYRILELLSPRVVVQHIQRLVDSLVVDIMKNGDEMHLSRIVEALDQMIWTHWLIPLERFVLSAVLAHYEEGEARAALYLVHALLTKSENFNLRINDLCSNLPSTHWKSEDWIDSLKRHYQNYPVLSWSQKLAEMSGQLNSGYPMLPVYFGNLAQSFLPVADLLIQKLIEIPQMSDRIFTEILNRLAPLYAFHPQPGLFLCITLFFYGSALADYPYRRKLLVLKISAALESCRPQGWLLSTAFRTYCAGSVDGSPSWVPTSEYFLELVERVEEGNGGALRPPAWAEYDWRFSEFGNPASQAFHGALVELMALPVHPASVSQSLLKLVLEPGASSKRYGTIQLMNSVAILITALPVAYHSAVYEEIAAALDWEYLGIEDSACQESLERNSLLLEETRPRRVLGFAHAFWIHATQGTLLQLPSFFNQTLLPKIQTEAQFLYAIRLVIPFLQRLHVDRQNSVMEVAVDVYKALAQLDQACGELEQEDTISDLLYHLKYMYVGDGIKNDIESIISELRPSLQSKLRYISPQFNETMQGQ